MIQRFSRSRSAIKMIVTLSRLLTISTEMYCLAALSYIGFYGQDNYFFLKHKVSGFFVVKLIIS